MSAFDYHAPATLDEALDLLGRHGEDAHLIAGGTAVVLLLKQGLISPGHLVALRGVAELRGVRRLADGGLEIRAMATHREAETAPDVAAYCAGLAETFARVATIRIRNQGTVGGNLAHADPAQDPPPMLLALGAEVRATSAAGSRTIALDAFFVDYFETALRPGEILTGVTLPPLPAGTRATYRKFLPRTEDDYATISVAAAMRVTPDGVCQHLRVGIGAGGTVPLRARSVERALEGQALGPGRVREAAALARDDVDPLDDGRGSAAYKREMARVWTERALLGLLGQPPPA